MNWWIAVIVIWLIGALYLYKTCIHVVDEFKAKENNKFGFLYDAVGIVIFLCWPLLVPKVIKRVFLKLRSKNNK